MIKKINNILGTFNKHDVVASIAIAIAMISAWNSGYNNGQSSIIRWIIAKYPEEADSINIKILKKRKSRK